MKNTKQIITAALGDDSRISYEDLESVLTPAQLYTLAMKCAEPAETLIYDEGRTDDDTAEIQSGKLNAKIKGSREMNFHIPIHKVGSNDCDTE